MVGSGGEGREGEREGIQMLYLRVILGLWKTTIEVAFMRRRTHFEARVKKQEGAICQSLVRKQVGERVDGGG